MKRRPCGTSTVIRLGNIKPTRGAKTLEHEIDVSEPLNDGIEVAYAVVDYGEQNAPSLRSGGVQYPRTDAL